MQIAHLHAQFMIVLTEVFSHPLGQRRDENATALCNFCSHLSQQMINLPFRRLHLNDRIEKSCRSDDLFDDNAAGMLQFVGTWRGGHMDDLVEQSLELLKLQRSIVDRRRQTKSILH